MPILGRRYYVAFFLGREKRNIWRIAAEAHKRSWWHTVFSIAVVTMMTSAMLMSTLATAYLLKSVLGIDLIDDHFILHAWFFN